MSFLSRPQTIESPKSEVSNNSLRYIKGMELSYSLLVNWPLWWILLAALSFLVERCFVSTFNSSFAGRIFLLLMDQLIDVLFASIGTALLLKLPLTQSIRFKPLLLIALLGGPLLSAPLLFYESLSGSLDSVSPALALIWLVLTLFVIIAGHFIFVPIVFGEENIKQIFHKTIAYVKDDMFLPLRAIVPAILIQALLLGITKCLFPEANNFFTSLMNGAGYACQKILLAILSAGYAVAFIPPLIASGQVRDSDHSLKQVQLNSLIIAIFSGSRKFIAMTVGIWLIALLRFQSAPLIDPPQSVRTDYKDKQIVIHFELTKIPQAAPIYASHFSLRTKNGREISNAPTSLAVNGEPLDLTKGILNRDKNQKLSLTFTTSRSKDQIERLTSLYLWYRSQPLIALHDQTPEKATKNPPSTPILNMS
jgi:hypothetical protein